MFKNLKIILIIFSLCFLLFTDMSVRAQDPGDDCDPDADTGYSARLLSSSGTIGFMNQEGIELQITDGSFIPAGTFIKTGPGANAELALEDGTSGRSSRIRITPQTHFNIDGGLYCSDLRPKADRGRWSVRGVKIELIEGKMDIEIADGVSHSFDLDINTPNSVIKMLRGTQDRVSIEIKANTHDDIKMIPIIDHPKVKSNIRAFLGGRSIEELSARDREGIMLQATMTAFSMGLIDIKELDILDDPQVKSTLNMMTQGRDLAELDEAEREMAMQTASAMAIQQGLIDPEELRVPDQPAENTYIAVHQGRFRIYNKHLGFAGDKVIEIHTGKYSNIKGYEIPEEPSDI